VLSVAVFKVVVLWKTNTADGSFCASRVRLPVRPNVPEAELYTPGVSGVPLSSVAMVVTGVRPAASL
jgi:hypothetical protein